MIKLKTQFKKPEIDLDGPQGNAFYLIGAAKNLAKQLDLDANSIQKEMMAGDYNHLLEAFNKHFGDVVDLVTQNEDYL